MKGEYNPDGSGVNLVIVPGAYGGSIGVSRAGSRYGPKVLIPTLIEGGLAVEDSTPGPWTYSSNRTSASDITPASPDPNPLRKTRPPPGKRRPHQAFWP